MSVVGGAFRLHRGVSGLLGKSLQCQLRAIFAGTSQHGADRRVHGGAGTALVCKDGVDVAVGHAQRGMAGAGSGGGRIAGSAPVAA